MHEGWKGDDHLIIFEEPEIVELTRKYDLSQYVNGYQIVGIKGWDDFILRNSDGQLFTIPTVPLDLKYLAQSNIVLDVHGLIPDERFKGKIKWYTKPVVFGGSPSSKDNIIWITLEQHIQIVKWWNKLYKDNFIN
jgi:hypothetical protein